MKSIQEMISGNKPGDMELLGNIFIGQRIDLVGYDMSNNTKKDPGEKVEKGIEAENSTEG